MKRLTIASILAPLAMLAATTAAAQGIKWHPGHYVMFGTEYSEDQVIRSIDSIGSESAVTGVQVRIRWRDLETSKGVYNFSKLDKYLARAKSRPSPKRLVVRIIDRKFNTTSTAGILPDYLLSGTYNGGLVKNSTGYVARLWEPAVMDRLIAVHQAIARRYDADPYFEGMATEETTLSVKEPFPSGYSNTALARQYERLISAVRQAAPQSNFFLYTNWIGSSSLMEDLLQELVASRGSAGGSNATPGKKTLGQKVWTGEYGGDYRGISSLTSSVEVSELRSYTPKQIADWSYSTLHLNHIFWVHNTWSGDNSRRWDTGILPFLRTKPPVRTRCPSSYGICTT